MESTAATPRGQDWQRPGYSSKLGPIITQAWKKARSALQPGGLGKLKQ
jgi:phage baseplate assembly protein W